MMRSRKRVIIGFTLAVLMLPAITLGQSSIHLSGVPEHLAFPLPQGANLVLTATIQGGAIQSVWLAPDAASSARVALSKADEGEYQINLGGRDVYRLLEKEEPDGEFRVFAETADGTIIASISVGYVVRVIPKRLEFPWDKATLTIYQRCSKELPGSRGNLRVRLGDITRGQVLLSVLAPDGKPLVENTSTREGDALTLVLGEEEYVIVADELVNFLVGEDYGVFSIFPARAWTRGEFNRLLKIIEESDLGFIRNEKEMTGLDFANHLRVKLEFLSAQRDAIPNMGSVDGLIDSIATQSSTTGKPYQIRLVHGEIIELAAWLRQQAKEVGKAKGKDKRSVTSETSDR